MKYISSFSFLIIFVLTVASISAQDSTAIDRYTLKEGDYNGIGKWYMGREIAYVMGYQGINWLERPEREKEEQTTKLIKNMDIQSTDVIADIGAGSGYHVYKMAPLTKKGKVFAVDIQEEMLTALMMNPKFNKYNTIETILGSEKSVNLPENTVDKVLMVDVYHEFSYPFEMLMSIKKALKPNGEIYLIEYRGEDNTVPIKRLHKMTENQAVKELKASGFKLKKNISNLPWQHCMVFIKE
ncbi:class I SAM-dependent methyltransferase [Winogradskyella sp. A2]|uniref:class I SAM-dependent methyltransferase n=1 Tax=Winogradskyella sp. A2 TaxID=3366944 RepID=UPI00398C49FA